MMRRIILLVTAACLLQPNLWAGEKDWAEKGDKSEGGLQGLEYPIFLLTS